MQLFFEPVRARNVVGIHKSNKATFGFLSQSVQGNRNTISLDVFINPEPFVFLFQGMQNRARIVRRKIVNRNDFNLPVGLVQKTGDTRRKRRTGVVDRQ
jgi:hypothetical protein